MDLGEFEGNSEVNVDSFRRAALKFICEKSQIDFQSKEVGKRFMSKNENLTITQKIDNFLSFVIDFTKHFWLQSVAFLLQKSDLKGNCM